jgi:murein DD-endopeptidase MepM/ murein hydrolase activator NlpD
MINRTLAAALALGAASQAQAAEVRLCERELRAAPLSEERGVQSALVQGFAVVNTGDKPVQLTGIALRLMEGDQLRDERRLNGSDIARAARQSPQITAVAGIFPAQFCNGALLAGAKLAGSDRLAPGEALYFAYQPFVWRGTRDRIEIVASTEQGSAASASSVTLAINPGASKTRLLYPVTGRSYVAVAASFHTPHRWAAIEEFAYDIAVLGPGGSTHRGQGTRLLDYAAFGKPVRAAAAGKVIAASGSTPDNAAMLKRPGESDEAYFTRLQEAQQALLTQGLAAVLGNYVMIDHGNGEYSLYAHLKQGSLRVAPGTVVEVGHVIGAIGSSGNSTEPHLHFQLCDSPDISACRPIPAQLTGYQLPLELAPRAIQSGDIVETLP